MAALITFEELTARPGFDGVNETEAEAVIDDVSALVIAIADLDTAWTAETVPAEVIPVIVSMVRRGLSNPLGRTGETLGDYTWQGSAGGLYATKQERGIIRRAAGMLSAKTVPLDSDLPLPPWRTGGAFEDEFLDSL